MLLRKKPALDAGKPLWHLLGHLLLAGLLGLGSILPAPAQTVADTTRRVVPVAIDTSEPPAEVTRRSATRIVGAIVVVTLITLLLYNVRSR